MKVSPRRLAALHRRIIACERCERLRDYCRQVATTKRRAYRDRDYWGRPVPSFGDPQARLLIIGLAPGAHGANRTGRMFTGDRSGDWVYGTLHKFGFAKFPDSTHKDDGQTLHDAYITAALRCAPPLNKPLPQELAACRAYLVRELELLQNVQVVVALGSMLVVSMVHRLQIQIRRSSNLYAMAQGFEFSRGLEAWAIVALQKDLNETGAVDSRQEPWAQGLPIITVEQGYLTGQMTDLDGRFNLNNL
ncbi:MAG: general secretion pathway protein GspK, partial [Armatimonadetes bacterium]|nr:general secretion pathway protein GspK [Armatimonadota bacterium]